MSLKRVVTENRKKNQPKTIDTLHQLSIFLQNKNYPLKARQIKRRKKTSHKNPMRQKY
jgi:hypothetical protein